MGDKTSRLAFFFLRRNIWFYTCPEVHIYHNYAHFGANKRFRVPIIKKEKKRPADKKEREIQEQNIFVSLLEPTKGHDRNKRKMANEP